MSDFKFEPWSVPPESINISVDVEGPPCLHCKHWNPQVKHVPADDGLQYDGIVICHAPSMEFDFSCFRNKHKIEEDEL